MKNKILIIANGPIVDENYHKSLLKNVDLIICADGGANTARKLGIKPDYIIGDLDSIKPEIYDFYKAQNTEIIKDENQDKTDLELAINLANLKDPSEIVIIGAIGRRIDHTLANILTLNKVKNDVKARIIDNYNTVELVDDDFEISGQINDIVSVIPLTEIYKLNCIGFKWNVENVNTEFGWFGISNKLKETKAKISLLEGKLLLIRIRE